MSDRIHVRAGDRGLVWVFAVDLDGPDLAAFNKRNGGWPAQAALGAATLDPEHVEVFPVSDLEGIGLSGYLEDGLGVPGEQLNDVRMRLDAQKGTVMVLSSRALGGSEQTLTPRAPLRLLASFSEERAPVSFEPLPSGDAAGAVSGDMPGKPVRDRLTWAGVLAFLLVVLIIVLIALVAS